jgi:hypothetical protein
MSASRGTGFQPVKPLNSITSLEACPTNPLSH